MRSKHPNMSQCPRNVGEVVSLKLLTVVSDEKFLAVKYSDDLAIMESIANRDESAMSEIYSRHAGPLTGFVKRCLAHEADADDIVHETMMEVWRRPERYQGRSSLKSWMFAIARFKSYDRNRKSGRTVLTDQEDTRICEDALPSEALAASQDAERVRSAMRLLSESHQRALHLSFFQDMTYKEIAVVEDCPVGTIKTRILHAKRKLMNELGTPSD